MAKIERISSVSFENLTEDLLIPGDIYIVKEEDQYSEYIIGNNKNKILINSKQGSEIYFDTRRFIKDPESNNLINISDYIHNNIFVWSGDRSGKVRINKLNNFSYRKIKSKDRNTLYFTTPCISFSINLGLIDGSTFKLPLVSTSEYNFDIEWGDGTKETITSASASHTYPEEKIYEIIISNKCPNLNFYSGYTETERTVNKYQEALIEVFLLDNITATDCSNMFRNCTNLTTISDIPSKTNNAEYMFFNCTKLVSTPDFCTTLKNTNHMFENCTYLASSSSIPNGVESASYMFSNCTSLKIAPYLGNSITDCSYMFNGCSRMEAFQHFPDSLKNATAMFKNCTSLLRYPEFNRSIQICDETFYNCASLNSIDKLYLDREKYNLVTSHSNCYYNCDNIFLRLNTPCSIYEIPQDWGGKYSDEYYYIAFSIEDISKQLTIDRGTVLTWGDGNSNGSSHQYKMQSIYNVVIDKHFGQISDEFTRTCVHEIINFSSQATDATRLFKDCSKLKTICKIPDNFTTLDETFSGCTNLNCNIEIGTGVTSCNNTFENCTSLKKVDSIPSNITTANSMFRGCTVLEEIGNLSSHLTSAEYMFYGCTALNIAPTIVNGLKTIKYMFSRSGISSAPLLPASITNCTNCFEGCENMVYTPKNWNVSYTGTITSTRAYTGCINLKVIESDIYKTNTEAMGKIPNTWK